MPDTTDPHDLGRFVAAQAGELGPGRSDYSIALAEVRTGEKVTHWMWYVFPQLAGLGLSAMAQRFAIRSRDEATAYLAHPVLGPRLVEIAEAALAVPDQSAFDIFGTPDDLKLKSCATLFAAVSPGGSAFHRVLDRFFGGEEDEKTLRLLARAG